jgi:hypothetical protein
LVGGKHLQKITIAYESLVDFLLQLKPDSRSVLLETLGTDLIVNLFRLPSFLVDAVTEIQKSNNGDGAVTDLLRVLGNEVLLDILQNGSDDKAVPHFRFEPWLGLYDRASWIKYFIELEKLMSYGFNHVLLISGADAKANNKTISITYNSPSGWTVVNTNLPPFVVTTIDTEHVAAQIYSVFGDEKVVQLSTQFCVLRHYSEEDNLHYRIYHLPEEQKKIAEQQALNSATFLKSEGVKIDKSAWMRKTFCENNQSLCQILIGSGIDFYACHIDQADSNGKPFNRVLFDALCEYQAKYNIEKLKVKIFETDWKIKTGGKKISDSIHSKVIKVPGTIKQEWDEIIAAENRTQTYYSAWEKIIGLRKEAATHNEDIFTLFRGKAAKEHYKSAANETPILQKKTNRSLKS